MRDRKEFLVLFSEYWIDHEHEISWPRHRPVAVKIFESIVLTYNRGKWPKDFPMFYFCVKQFLGIGIARVCQYAPCPQCSRSPFHSPLEPADNFIFENHLCCFFNNFPFVFEF